MSKPSLTMREFNQLCDLDLIRVVAVGPLRFEGPGEDDPPEVLGHVRQEVHLAVRGADLRRNRGHGVWMVG